MFHYCISALYSYLIRSREMFVKDSINIIYTLIYCGAEHSCAECSVLKIPTCEIHQSIIYLTPHLTLQIFNKKFSETVAALFTILRARRAYRLNIRIKRVNDHQNTLAPTFTSNIDVLFIYFRKYLKLMQLLRICR